VGLEWHFPALFTGFLFDSLRSAYLYRHAFPGWRWWAPELASALRLLQLKQELLALWDAVPPGWRACVGGLRLASPDFAQAREDAVVRVLSSLVLPPALPVLPLAGLQALRQYVEAHVPALPLAAPATVRQLTRLQPDDALAARWPRLEAFLRAAESPAGLDVPFLLSRLRDLWAVPWDNGFKEPFWRLALNGFALYGDARFMRGQPARPCHCRQGLVGREHCFWGCCVAAAVHRSVAAALAAWAPAGPLLRHHLWLAEPPDGVHGGVWLVVALAAVSAINTGRRHLVGLCLSAPGGVEPPLPPPGPTAALPATHAQLVRACVLAEERFWALLADFVSLARMAPRAWRARYGPVPSSHPFLCGRMESCLAVGHRPAAVALSVVPPVPLALPAP
jgi:hypothetical protein